MPRLSDIFFAFVGVAVIVMLTLHMAVAVFALVGAFACGSIYVFAGMIPSREETFGTRVFISVFLAVVLSSIVLILPGTLGPEARRPEVATAVFAIAGMIPLIAFCFEVFRTPNLVAGVRRYLGLR